MYDWLSQFTFFSSNGKLRCWQQCWVRWITDIRRGWLFGKQASSSIVWKNFLFAGGYVFIEPVHRRGKSRLITKWQRIENSWESKILEKMRHCLWKFELWFWTYGWIHLIDPSAPNIVSRPQTPWSRIFLRFHNCIGFISWFLRKWGPVCEKWSYGSGLMAGYVFLAQVTQM